MRAPVAQRVAGRRVAVRAPRMVRKTLVVQAAKKSVGDLSKADLEGKAVFVRADLNVPLDKELNITDDTRIRAAVPTLKYLLDNGAKVLLTSHLVRRSGGLGTGAIGFSEAQEQPGCAGERPLGLADAPQEPEPERSEPASPALTANPPPPPASQGRPKSGPEDKFRLTPVAPRLQELLGKPVRGRPRARAGRGRRPMGLR